MNAYTELQDAFQKRIDEVETRRQSAGSFIQGASANLGTQYGFPPESIRFFEIGAQPAGAEEEVTPWAHPYTVTELKENGTYGCEVHALIKGNGGAYARVRLFPEVAFDGDVVRLGLQDVTDVVEFRSGDDRDQKSKAYAGLMLTFCKEWIPRIASPAAREKFMGFSVKQG